MTRRFVVTVAFAVAALAVAPATLAAGRHEPVACGDTITSDTRLTANVVDCTGVGLIIGADGITLDLNGHRVEGDGSGDDVGIDLAGRRGVTIANGTVRAFGEGVLVVDSSEVELRRLTSADQRHGGITVDRSSDVIITGNVVRHSGAGMIVLRSEAVLVGRNHVSGTEFGGIPVFESRQVRIADNTVTSSSDAAVGLFAGSSHSEVTGNRLSRSGAGVALNADASGNVIAGNTIAHNASGVIVDVGTHDNRILDNVVEDSTFEGVAVVGSDGNLIARNRVVRNGGTEAAGGIVVIPWPEDPAETSDANALVDNVAIDNQGDGIVVGPARRGNLLRGNQADRNTALGIDAAPGTLDGGGNRAARNGDSRQCVGVACEA